MDCMQYAINVPILDDVQEGKPALCAEAEDSAEDEDSDEYLESNLENSEM